LQDEDNSAEICSVLYRPEHAFIFSPRKKFVRLQIMHTCTRNGRISYYDKLRRRPSFAVMAV
jgi:hypothetical protein